MLSSPKMESYEAIQWSTVQPPKVIKSISATWVSPEEVWWEANSKPTATLLKIVFLHYSLDCICSEALWLMTAFALKPHSEILNKLEHQPIYPFHLCFSSLPSNFIFIKAMVILSFHYKAIKPIPLLENFCSFCSYPEQLKPGTKMANSESPWEIVNVQRWWVCF